MPQPRVTHTYAILEISPAAFHEIHSRMLAAGYQHAFHDDGLPGLVIDMHGIAVAADPALQTPATADAPLAPGADPAGDTLAIMGETIPGSATRLSPAVAAVEEERGLGSSARAPFPGRCTRTIGGYLCVCRWPIPGTGMVQVRVCDKCHLPIVPKPGETS